MRHYTFQLLLLFSLLAFSNGGPQASVAFSNYHSLLQANVCNGGVHYEGAAKMLSEAEKDFGLTTAQFEGLAKKEKLAYLINLYNFYTIQLIANHLPLKSIRDLKDPWKQKFIPFRDKKVSLDHIEHEVIRKEFDEPRIHFALVCAAVSCPPLINEAFRASTLDQQLERTAREFIGNPKRNRLDGKTMYLSKIFEWYGKDFNNKHGSYQNYVAKMMGKGEKAKVKFLDYDWSLNRSKPCES